MAVPPGGVYHGKLVLARWSSVQQSSNMVLDRPGEGGSLVSLVQRAWLALWTTETADSYQKVKHTAASKTVKPWWPSGYSIGGAMGVWSIESAPMSHSVPKEMGKENGLHCHCHVVREIRFRWEFNCVRTVLCNQIFSLLLFHGAEGVLFGDLRTPSLLFADDVVLLVSSSYSLHHWSSLLMTQTQISLS